MYMMVDSLSYIILQEPHTLIAGATGSGKSTLLNNVLLTANKLNRAFAIIDLKRVSVLAWKDKAIRYATEPETALDLMDLVIDTMEKRFRTMEALKQAETDKPPLYLIVDECADLLDTVKDSYLKLKKIARLGRAAQIHLIICSQAPSRRVIPADLTLNISCRVGLRCESAIESRQVIGKPGCEMLPRYGFAIVKTPQGIDKWKIDILN